MAPFTFPLEQVLRYRRQLEDQAMQALAVARQQRDAMVTRIAFLEQERVQQLEKMSRAYALSPAELWLIREYDASLQRELEQCRADLIPLEEAVDVCHTDLVKKAQERELLDTLKEKQVARHAQEEKRKEQKEYDETATLRFSPVPI